MFNLLVCHRKFSSLCSRSSPASWCLAPLSTLRAHSGPRQAAALLTILLRLGESGDTKFTMCCLETETQTVILLYFVLDHEEYFFQNRSLWRSCCCQVNFKIFPSRNILLNLPKIISINLASFNLFLSSFLAAVFDGLVWKGVRGLQIYWYFPYTEFCCVIVSLYILYT